MKASRLSVTMCVISVCIDFHCLSRLSASNLQVVYSQLEKESAAVLLHIKSTSGLLSIGAVLLHIITWSGNTLIFLLYIVFGIKRIRSMFWSCVWHSVLSWAFSKLIELLLYTERLGHVECYMYFSIEESKLISDVMIWMHVVSKSSTTLICYNWINKYRKTYLWLIWRRALDLLIK